MSRFKSYTHQNFNVQKLWCFFSQCTWTLPFLAFLCGYICLQFFIADSVIQTPDFVGKDLLQAVKISSDQKLNLRIIAEKEVTDAKPGTIINQNPLPHSSIKKDQSVFIIITKLPTPVKAPGCIAKNEKEIEKLCKAQNIKYRLYFLPTHYPIGQCFAQMPCVEHELEDKKLSCYISTGNQNQYLFPDFTGQNLHEVTDFLKKYQINFDIYHKDQKISQLSKQNYTIIYQKPLAGTLIMLNNKLYVQLQVA